MTPRREDLLELYGRVYGDLRPSLAIEFTRSIEGEDAKRCSTGWDKAKPLPTPDFGAGLLKERGKRHNPVVVLRPSRLIGLESDTPEGLRAILALELPKTVTVQSSAPHRLHFWFRVPMKRGTLVRPAMTVAANRQRAADLNGAGPEFVAFRFEAAGITADRGRYLLAPPAVHPSGAVYRFLVDPIEDEIAVLPQERYDELVRLAKHDDAGQRERLRVDPGAKITEGKRRETIFRFACSQRAFGASDETILEAARALNRDRCEPPLSDEQVAHQVHGALAYEPATALPRTVVRALVGGDIDLAPKEAQDAFKPSSRPRPASSSRPRPQVSSSLVPTPYGGDEDEHLVPVLVPTSFSQPHSWHPSSLTVIAAEPPRPPELLDLFYPGYNHVVSGESEALKTWLVLAAATVELGDGYGALWVDGDDVGPGALLERLRLLGAADEAIDAGFAYVRPDEPLTEERRADVLDVVRARGCRLAVLDGFNPLLTLHGLDPNKGTDVEAFYRHIDPIRKLGVAVVLTDNVVKSREARGAWAIGSERKKSKADVHLGMRALSALVRGGSGRARIDVHKDRPGHLTRPVAGLFVIESGTAFSWRVDPDDSRDEQGEFRPTELMLKVSRFLEQRPGEPQSRNQIEGAKLGKGAYVRVAIDRLIAEGFATEFEGPHSARLVRLERPFHDDEEPE